MLFYDIFFLVLAAVGVAFLLVPVFRDPGMARRKRVTRWVHAIGLCLVSVSLVAVGRTSAEWAAFLVLAVVAGWALVILALRLQDRIEQTRGLRADATLGQLAAPTPLSATRAFFHWIAWSVGGGTVLLLAVMVLGVILEPELTSSVMNVPDAWKLILGADILIIVAAGIGVLIQKLTRDEAVRYHEALTEGITARLRAEEAAGYGKGYSDALSGTAPNEGS